MAAALGMKDLSRDTQLFENFDTDKSGQLDTGRTESGLGQVGTPTGDGCFSAILFASC